MYENLVFLFGCFCVVYLILLMTAFAVYENNSSFLFVWLILLNFTLLMIAFAVFYGALVLRMEA